MKLYDNDLSNKILLNLFCVSWRLGAFVAEIIATKTRRHEEFHKILYLNQNINCLY